LPDYRGAPRADFGTLTFRFIIHATAPRIAIATRNARRHCATA
jgi:hypothetical protein